MVALPLLLRVIHASSKAVSRTQPKKKDDDSQRIILFALHDANASDVRDLIRGASKCGNVRRNSCAVQLKQKLLGHRSRSPVLFLPEIRTRSDVFRSNTQALSMSSGRPAGDGRCRSLILSCTGNRHLLTADLTERKPRLGKSVIGRKNCRDAGPRAEFRLEDDAGATEVEPRSRRDRPMARTCHDAWCGRPASW